MYADVAKTPEREATKGLTTKDTAEWPQFRGPDGQGHVVGAIPVSWSEKANKSWVAPIPGKGWSSPVISQGKIWLTTSIPGKNDHVSLRAIAVDQKSGKLLHDIELFTTIKPTALHGRNSPASPSPVCGNGRLFAQFGNDGTACVDTSTGKVIWRNNELRVSYETGPASSPVLYKDRLIFPCDGADLQFVVALSASTGKLLWKTDRPQAVKKSPNERRAFATPLVISVEGRDQVVIPGAHCVYSYEPTTGVELWRVAYQGFSNVLRPIFAHGLVYVSTGYFAHELLAIRPDGKGDVTSTHIAWRTRKNVPNVPSPVIVGDLLFMVSDLGIATCHDAKTGDMKWTKRIGVNLSASLLASENTIYAFGDDGKTVLFAASASFEGRGSNSLNGRVQATPAAVGGCLYIRTESALYRLEDGKVGVKR